MSPPEITALYASLLALLFIGLSVRVAIARWKLESYLGADDARLSRLGRVHANFSENVPFALILIGFGETLGAASTATHGLCVALLLARAAHAYGVSQEPEPIWWRICGYSITCIVIGVAALINLFLATK
jgi:uncharacterized membrane protein YecN with MAPEG domain